MPSRERRNRAAASAQVPPVVTTDTVGIKSNGPKHLTVYNIQSLTVKKIVNK